MSTLPARRSRTKTSKDAAPSGGCSRTGSVSTSVRSMAPRRALNCRARAWTSGGCPGPATTSALPGALFSIAAALPIHWCSRGER